MFENKYTSIIISKSQKILENIDTLKKYILLLIFYLKY